MKRQLKYDRKTMVSTKAQEMRDKFGGKRKERPSAATRDSPIKKAKVRSI